MIGQQGGIRAATRAVNSAAMAYFLKFLSSKNFQFMMVEIIVRVQTLGRNKNFFSASQPEERIQWTENKKIACNAILKRFKESYNNGSTRALTYTLSLIATLTSKMNKCQEKET